MFNDDKGRRSIALSITHYAYRNTKLEDYHSDCVKMDKKLYHIVYNIVRSKLNNVRLLQRYIDEFPCEDISSDDVLNELINNVPQDLQLKFIKYFQAIIWGRLYVLSGSLRNRR